MRSRVYKTTPDAEIWFAFDQLEPGDDESIPETFAITTDWGLTSEILGPTPEAALAEWNRRKATALDEGKPILIYGGRKPWTREQVEEAVMADPFDGGGTLA